MNGPIRLRETPHAARPGAVMIDAQYRVVGARKGKSVLGRVKAALLAIAVAALLGFLIPPIAIVLMQLFAES